MKKFTATATVRFKKSVLEPQGKAIQLSLAEKGSHEFTLVRVGKYIEVELEAASLEEAQKKMEKIAGDMLYNDVMETCEIHVAPVLTAGERAGG
ncbi:MAG: phosphoribosylformylglycinamidine synthase subunit PurS [Leptospiraceae bacterium]|nr:phosphoribosylformylglycinamidine synthase subunit PurS [Leptospiraceae bacterium]